MSSYEMNLTFEVTREDNCIWIKDLRDGLIRHIVPEQARELIIALDEVLHPGMLENT